MRCPDCSKFVGMENGDPEINSLEAEFSLGSFTITLDARHTRNCADCGTELKSIDINEEANLDPEDIPAFNELPEEKRKAFLEALESKEVEAEIEEDGSEADEAGGGRYKANQITVRVNYTLTMEHDGTKISHTGTIESVNTAGSYEECC